jgi:hypothetical protein
MIRFTAFTAFTAVLAASLTVSPRTAEAQSPSQPVGYGLKGLSVGVHGTVNGLTLTAERNTFFGGGLALAVGYGLTESFSVHSLTSAAWLLPSGRTNFLLSHVDLEGRYRFAGGSGPFAPHLSLGISGRHASSGDPLRSETGESLAKRTTVGVTPGIGMSYFVSPSSTLDWSLRHTVGNAQQPRCPQTDDGGRSCLTSTRVNFGMSWYPSIR